MWALSLKRNDLIERFRGSNHIDVIRQPRREEPAPKSGLLDFGNLKVSKSATADFDAGVSKDGHKRDRASGHPSRRRYAPPQDEVRGFE